MDVESDGTTLISPVFTGWNGLNNSLTVVPYQNSELILTIRDFNGNFGENIILEENSTISVTIYDTNEISAYCGMPSSTIYYSTDYQSRIPSLTSTTTTVVPSIATMSLYSNGTLAQLTSEFIEFGTFPMLGSFDCSYLNDCSGHGVCDYCAMRCVCDDGYGSALDLYRGFVNLGNDISSTCSMRKYISI